MDDRLVEILKHFKIEARVFYSGILCRSTIFNEEDVGYIHILKQGAMKVVSPHHPGKVIDEPSLILYMNPTEHQFRQHNESEPSLVCATFKFGSGLLNPVVRAMPRIICLKLSELTFLNNILASMFHEASEQHCGRQAILDRLMEVIFIYILRDLMDENRIELGLLAGLADQRLSKSITAMHADPANNWGLEDLAKISNMSRARFSARFHEVVGMTPGNYLSGWRIGIAQSMLKDGKSMQLIASDTGYGSSSALSRAFKSQTGLSPKDWLKSFEK